MAEQMENGDGPTTRPQQQVKPVEQVVDNVVNHLRSKKKISDETVER